MHISFSPVRSDAMLSVAVDGDVININGSACDLSSIPDGGSVPGSGIDDIWFVGEVRRTDAELHLTLILPHGPAAPGQTRFPGALSVTENGPVAVPPHDADAGGTASTP